MTAWTVTKTDLAGTYDSAIGTRSIFLPQNTAGMTDTGSSQNHQGIMQAYAGLTDTPNPVPVKNSVNLPTTDKANLRDGVATFFYDDIENELATSATMTDSIVIGHGPAATDAMGMTDAIVSSRVLVFTDSAGLSDPGLNVTKNNSNSPTFAEMAGISETVVFARSLSNTDAAGLSDLFSRSFLPAPYNENAGLTDILVLEHDFVFNELAAGADSATVVHPTSNFNDNLELSDTVSIIRMMVMQDALTFTDSAGPGLRTVRRDVAVRVGL